jgi:hypothetical protein
VFPDEEGECPGIKKPWITLANAAGALAAAMLAPTKQILRRVIRPVSRSGAARQFEEEWWLDPEDGQVIQHTEYSTVDDTGKIGDPQKLAAICAGCNGPVFEAIRCLGCGRMFGHCCLKKFKDVESERSLCRKCYRIAQWNRENWAEFDAGQKGESWSGE